MEEIKKENDTMETASPKVTDTESEEITADITEDTENHEKGHEEEKKVGREEEEKDHKEKNSEADHEKDSKENGETNHTINSKKDNKEDIEKDHEKNSTTDSKQDGETSHEENDETEERLPEIHLPDPTSGYENDISVFCISQQGESHIKNNLPCQDRSGFRWVNKQIVIASIADGVGSCQLSDYGAETAVKSSLDFLEEFLKVEMNQPGFVFYTPS